MSLNAEEIKVAIIMMKRASCSGEESGAVATVIMKLEQEYLALQPEATNDSEKELPEEDEGE